MSFHLVRLIFPAQLAPRGMVVLTVEFPHGAIKLHG